MQVITHFRYHQFILLLAVMFSACGGTDTFKEMPVQIADFPRAGSGRLGRRGIVLGTRKVSYYPDGLFYPSVNITETAPFNKLQRGSKG